ncbi:MAG: phosphatase PAP2 family protein [Bacteroidota bacterium]
MTDFLFSLDLSLFWFGNRTLQNPLFDLLMPFVTDLNKKPVALVVAAILWLFLLVKGGKQGRIAALLLIPTIALGDQLNSSVLKHMVERIRPCHTLPDIHLLVSCGSGYSFPSSHAVNNFAAALVLAYFERKWTWAFFTFAGTVSFSRVYVGVHYPSDVLAGALIGLLVGLFILLLYTKSAAWFAERKARASSES